MMLPKSLIDQCMMDISSDACEGLVMGQGPTGAPLMLIGEAPGADEVAQGQPFVGQAGKNLSRFLQSVGLKREDIFITNTFRCRPFKTKERRLKSGEIKTSKSNRPPTTKEIKAHAPLLDGEIAQVQPKMLVPLGNVPLKRLLGNQVTISQVHGQLLERPVLYWNYDEEERGTGRFEQTAQSYLIYPMYHPAAVIYRPALEEVLEADIKRLSETLQQLEGNIPISKQDLT